MFGLAGETEFDIRFSLFGISVRVHPMFWLSSAWMVWSENLQFTLVGILSIFLSVLVHELGHALVIRRFGYPSEIVLYFFCGYATSTHFPFRRALAVSAAGPAAGLALGAIVYGIARAVGFDWFAQYPLLFDFVLMMIWGGFIVNILNLIPSLPLDGGQMMDATVRHLTPNRRTAQELALRISIGVSGAIALWAAYCLNTESLFFPEWCFAWLPRTDALLLSSQQPDPRFEMIFMGYLCAANVVQFNQLRAWN